MLYYVYGVLDQLVRLPACHAGGHGFESRTLRQVLCSGRLSVRTPPFHGGKRGSIPLPSTSYTCRSLTTLENTKLYYDAGRRRACQEDRSQVVPFESDGEYQLYLSDVNGSMSVSKTDRGSSNLSGDAKL